MESVAARRLRLVGLLTMCLGAFSGCSGSTVRPNILFILIDSLRYDHVGFAGYHLDTSPCLDSLASAGVAFTLCTAQEPQTLGSVPSLVTGRYPESSFHRTSTTIPQESTPVPAASLGEGIPTVATVLRRNGYTTAAFIASALVNRRIWGAWEQFDHWDGSVECCDGDCAARVNERIVEWLAGGAREPWFFYVHYNDVHHPYGAPPKYAERFSRSYGMLPVPDLEPMRARAQAGELSSEELEHFVGMYDAEIAYVDHQICRLLSEVAALGQDRNLLIIIASDHGDEFHEHGSFGHTRTLYEELTRVPLVLVWRGHIPEGTVIDSRVRNVDIVPTVLDLVRADAPPGLQGTSLVPYFEGQGSDRTAFSQMWDTKKVSVRHGRWKLWQDPYGRLELYDLQADAEEQSNLARALPDTVRSLQGIIRSWERQLPKLHEPAERPTGPTLDSIAVSKLRALGYIQ